MVKSIPPGGNISRNTQGKRRREPKPIEANGNIIRHIGVRIGPRVSNRPATRRSSGASESYRIQGRPITEKSPGKGTLEQLLTWGQQEEQRCINLLRTLPAELPEYNQVLEKLGKLQDVLAQVKRQLAAKS